MNDEVKKEMTEAEQLVDALFDISTSIGSVRDYFRELVELQKKLLWEIESIRMKVQQR